MTRDDERADILLEIERLDAESHVAVAKSLIVLEEVRALRQRVDADPEAVFSTIAERQLRRLDRGDPPPVEGSERDRGA